jgi:CMP-N-acetylneuraminic acid synthetase
MATGTSVRNMVAIVPARGGSKGLPRKNLRELGGLPLIAWTIKAAKECPLIDSVIVTSDDPEILSVSAQYGADELITRPPQLATDSTSSIDVISHTLENTQISANLILLQPTSPLRNHQQIFQAISDFQNLKTLSLISVTESTESPFWTFTVQNGFLAPLIETKQFVYQRQLLPKTYILNGAIYIRNIEDFVKTKQLIPENSMPFIMDLQSSADIDSLEDLKSVEKFLKYHFPAK